MSWGAYSNWREEDRHAVVVYLRHLKPSTIRSLMMTPQQILSAVETYYGTDFGDHVDRK